ncbi:hypothetical protein IIU_07059 [Bacillus cereus VD133]|uniref:Endospore appendages core domain-containing protein n=1 Tax=Bacillus cereus VD133 TaxID=1053233 RepID=A0A9W5UYQ7_BACCE|nr:S-Ena type endospore appendage [Bacillus cereus]EOO23304.1 hypothetical protein IIU_07059 [Bacillus cereus VD133]
MLKPIPPCFLVQNSTPPIPVNPVISECPCELTCTDVCGNILLNNQISELKIWKKTFCSKGTITITIFNSSISTNPIKVLAIEENNELHDFFVPSGNTLSRTIDDIKTVIVSSNCKGIVQGTFCLEVCHFIQNKQENKKHNY